MDSVKHGGCDCFGNNMVMHGIIILLLIFIVWKLIKVERLTAYVGSGLPNNIYTSGADQRFAQVFSSTDQGV